MPHAPRRVRTTVTTVSPSPPFEDLFNLVMETRSTLPRRRSPIAALHRGRDTRRRPGFRRRFEFDLLIAEVEANVSSFKPLPRAAYDLDVLPRHRSEASAAPATWGDGGRQRARGGGDRALARVRPPPRVRAAGQAVRALEVRPGCAPWERA